MDDRPTDFLFAEQPAVPRIVQYRQRRYSIRMEKIFWQFLEHIAREHNTKLGRLVAVLAESATGKNLTSHIRAFCMFQAEQMVARLATAAGRAHVGALVSSCPAPGLVLSRDRRIVLVNDALSAWLGDNHPVLVGAELTGIFQIRTQRPLNEMWMGLVSGNVPRCQAKFVYVAPGRVLAAEARLMGYHSRRRDGFACIAWLAPPGMMPARRIPPAVQVPPNARPSPTNPAGTTEPAASGKAPVFLRDD